MSAGVYDFVGEQACALGATFRRSFTKKVGGSVVDLSTYTAVMEVRSPSGTLIATFSTANGHVILASSSPNITLYLPLSVVNTLEIGMYEYDFFLIAANTERTKELMGAFEVVRKVTAI